MPAFRHVRKSSAPVSTRVERKERKWSRLNLSQCFFIPLSILFLSLTLFFLLVSLFPPSLSLWTCANNVCMYSSLPIFCFIFPVQEFVADTLGILGLDLGRTAQDSTAGWGCLTVEARRETDLSASVEELVQFRHRVRQHALEELSKGNAVGKVLLQECDTARQRLQDVCVPGVLVQDHQQRSSWLVHDITADTRHEK